MASDSGKAAKEKTRAERKAKRASSGKEKEKNPVLKEARQRYAEQLRKQGVAEDQMKDRMKAHLKDVVRPAMNDAKAGAKSKNLKGPERRKYIQDTVRGKLGMQA